MNQDDDLEDRQFEPEYGLFSKGIKTAASKLTGDLVVIAIAMVTLGWVAIRMGESGSWAGAMVATVMIFLLAFAVLLLSGRRYAQDERVEAHRADAPIKSETEARRE